MSPTQQNVLTHLDLWRTRVEWYLQRYAHRFPERLYDPFHKVSDAGVGAATLKRAFELDGLVEIREKSTQWVHNFGIPPVEVIEAALARLHTRESQWLLEQSSRSGALDAGPELFLPLEEIRASFGLSELDVEILATVAVLNTSHNLLQAYNVLQGDPHTPKLTVGWLCDLVAPETSQCELVERRLHEQAPLLRSRLLTLSSHPRWKPNTPRRFQLVEIPQRVLDYLRGWSLGDVPLVGSRWLEEHGPQLADLVVDSSAVQALRDGLTGRDPFRLGVLGTSGVGKRTLIGALARDERRRVLEVDMAALLSFEREPLAKDPALDRIGEALREAALHNALALIRLDDLGDHPRQRWLEQHLVAIDQVLRTSRVSVVISDVEASRVWQRLVGAAPSVELEPPGPKGQRLLWHRSFRRILRMKNEVVVEKLTEPIARSFRLTPRTIEQACTRVGKRLRPQHGLGAVEVHLTSQTLFEAVHGLVNHQLGHLAEPYAVDTLTLADVVLTDDARKRLGEVLQHARQADRVFNIWGFAERSPMGQGLSVLLSGPPGTGKTLVAGVLARELGRVAYRVDLSKVVDKYIGETEKNLGRIFDEASRAQAVLLFDEADSLFAKRTSVKSSHDRYANLEVNYLLQRIEAYKGVSILTTNLETSLDEAFQRRIAFRVSMPMPEATLRAELWERLLPPKAPVNEGIDFDRLAEEFELAGGSIKNAILRAAIQAADLGQQINEDLLWDAALVESRKGGRLVPEYHSDYIADV